MRLFAGNTQGNVAVLFAAAAIPLIGAVGMAVDYGRATAAKTRLQNALDSTALALAFEPANLTDAELQTRGMEIFAANFPNHADYVTQPLTVTREDGTVVVHTSGRVPTTLTGLFDVDTLGIDATSQATWGGGRVELALVLDNTGSMRGAKLRELKDAASMLLDTLESSVREPEDVKVSIIPFNTQVKLATSYENADWLLMPDEEEAGGRGRRGRGRDGRGRPGRGGGEPFQWTGCVEDRQQPYDVSDAPFDPDRPEQTGYPATDCEKEDLADLLPLTQDFAALRDKIEDMNADGMTNITIGIAWGMTSLSRQAPLTEADPPNEPHLRRVMVVLTDGDNTENRWTTNRRDIDERTRRACTEAKDAEITVYTVRVMDGNANLLRDCASESQFFFNVENVADLMPAFQGIARSISKLRLAR